MSITKLVYKDLPFKVTASAKGYYDYENLFSLSKDSNISIEMKEYNEGNIEYSEPVESAAIVSVQANHLPNYKYLSKIRGCLMPYGREYKDLKTGRVSFKNNGCAQEGSAFTGANNAYISTEEIFDFENFNSWEIQVCYNYNGGGSYPAIVATESNGRDFDGINFCYEGGVLKLWLGNTEYSNWNVASFDTQLSLTEGTTYYIKFGFTGTEYYFQYNTDGSETYSDKVTYSSTNKIKTHNKLIFLNNGYNLSNYYNNGSIDLSKTRIIVEGEVVWAYPKVTSKISSLPGTLLNYEDTGAPVDLDLYVISNLNKDENYFVLTKENDVSIEGYKCQWVGKANIPSHDTFTYEEIDIVIEDFTNYKCEISNHIASGGFDTNTNTGKYIDTKEVMPLSEADSWEYQISVKNISAYKPSNGGNIISGSNSSDFKHPSLYIPSNEIQVYLGSTGSGWDIVSGRKTGIKVNPLNKYYFKYGFTGSKYYLDYATETNFTPVLTSNNTLGGDSPACAASHESQPAWWAFDGDLTTNERCWWTSHGACTEENPCWITFYYPVGIIPNGFFLKNEVATPANPKSFKFEASNDNSTWTVLWETTEWPNETGYSETVDFGEQVKESYKYFRWYIYEGYESGGVSIQELAVRSENLKSKTDFSNAFSIDSTKKVYCDCTSRFLNNGYGYSSNKYILNGDLYLDELKLLINGETYWTPYKSSKKAIWTPSSNEDNPYKDNEIIPQSILSEYASLSGKTIPILTESQYDYTVGGSTTASINGVEYSASYVLPASDKVADKGRSLYYVIYSLSEKQLVSILFNVVGELEVTPPTELK